MNITGAELITRYLERQGVEAVAGAAAATLKPLVRAMAQSSILHLPRGYSGVRIAGSDTALGSLAANAPALCIAGMAPRAQIGGTQFRRRERFPEVKAWLHTGAAFELLELLPLAWDLAHDGNDGCVVLEIPQDVLDETIDGAWLPVATAHAQSGQRRRTTARFGTTVMAAAGAMQ